MTKKEWLDLREKLEHLDDTFCDIHSLYSEASEEMTHCMLELEAAIQAAFGALMEIKEQENIDDRA